MSKFANEARALRKGAEAGCRYFLAGLKLSAGKVLLAWAVLMMAQASPGLTWRWCNPIPHGNNVVDMTWNGELAVQVTDLGQIYTGLGFQGWTPRNSGTTNTLQAVRYFGNRLVFVGANGTAGYSDDGANFTVSSLNTADWLVDLAVSSNRVVAVGDNAVIFSSSDGAKWAFQTNAPNASPNWLLSVAWGAGTFVTTGEGGYVATSPDGTHWTSRTSGVTADLTRVAWVNGTGFSGIFPYTGFWAVTANGGAIFSTNRGASWQSFNVNGGSNALYAIAANDSTGLLAGDAELRLGTDSGTWPRQTNPLLTASPAPAWTYYTALWDDTNSMYRVAGADGLMVQSTSTNRNYFWTDPSSASRDWLWQVTVANQLYVAAGDNARILTSQNGVDWAVEAIPLTNSVAGSPTNTVFLCLDGNTNLLLAAGNHGSLITSPNTLIPILVTNLDGTVFTNLVSSQGIIWYAQPAPTTNDLTATCAFGTNFFLVGGNGTALLSPDGTNWSAISVPTSSYLSGLAPSTNLLVATGDQGTILTTSDGRTWSKRTSGTTNWLFRARCLNGLFLAVGEKGTLLKSTNGVNWNALVSGTTNWLNDAIMLSNTCFVVGNNGTVLSSTNLVDWTWVPTITSQSLYGAASQNGQLVTVGLEGTILRSQVVPDLTPIQFISYAQADGDNIFGVAGKPDQQFSLDSSIDLTNWTTGPTLDLIYGSGTLLFFIPAATNEPPAEFFRATLVP
ncbi:MAG TPA: hypothetical protein VFE51_19415 [Verrucomicrobiae bacterium]|nr:hypothetical protein [Verrucomicrobiae bacterium]